MRSTQVELAAVIGGQTLKLLKEASKFVPFPAIGLAAAFALEILNSALAADGNRDEFIAIGKYACEVMKVVIRRVNHCAIASIDMTDLQKDADALGATMKEIASTVEKHINRGFLKRMVFNADDSSVVQQCKDRLNFVLQLFGLQSSIELRQQVAVLHQKIDLLLNQASSSAQRNTSSQSLLLTRSELLAALNTESSSSPQLGSLTQPLPSGRALRYPTKAQQHVIEAPLSMQHLPPYSNISHTYVTRDATTINRDDSLNISGTGNNINISYVR